MSIPPIPPWSIMKFRECVQCLAWRIRGRVRYLESTNDARRLELMRLRDENLRLRHLAGISPQGKVPLVPQPLNAVEREAFVKQWTQLHKGPVVQPTITWVSDVADDEPEYPECTCPPTCNRFECKGKCGCRGCEVGYMNFLSGE
jgi:hypothetical protein